MFGARSWSSDTPAGCWPRVDEQAQPALRVRPGDAGAVVVLLEPQRVRERDARHGTRAPAATRSRGRPRSARARASCSATHARAVDEPEPDDHGRDRAQQRGAGVVVGDRAREVGAAAAQPPAGERRERGDDDQVREARQQHARRRRRRARRRRSAGPRARSPRATVRTTKEGHSHAPRIRQRMRVTQSGVRPAAPPFQDTLAAPGGDPVRAPRRGRARPEDPGGAESKGNTPHGDRSCSVRDLARGPAGRIGAPDHGRPGRTAARDADDARHRGARDDALPPGQGPRLVLRRLRPGGRLRRAGVGDGRRTTASASSTATSPRT